MKSQSDVRTALVEFLMVGTKILNLLVPAIQEEMKEKFPVKEKREIRSKRPSTPLAGEDDDEIPF